MAAGKGVPPMRNDDRSDRSERSARVLLFLALCGAVFWALTSGPA